MRKILGRAALVGTVAFTLAACVPPPVLKYSEKAVACDNTQGYTGPERCGSWTNYDEGYVMDPGPWYLYNNDLTYHKVSPFVPSNP